MFRFQGTFNHQMEVPDYARMVAVSEIADPKNDYNLNLPRYIDSTVAEEIQDLTAHLRSGIPERDLDALHACWDVISGVRAALFKKTTIAATASSASRRRLGEGRPAPSHHRGQEQEDQGQASPNGSVHAQNGVPTSKRSTGFPCVARVGGFESASPRPETN